MKHPAKLDRLMAAIGAALVVATIVVLATSSTAATNSDTTAAAPANGAPVTRIVIHNFDFMPKSAVVKVGTKLTFVNQDSAPHTGTASDGKAFDTGLLKQGQQKVVMLAKPGTVDYVCSVHPFMKATLQVVN